MTSLLAPMRTVLSLAFAIGLLGSACKTDSGSAHVPEPYPDSGTDAGSEPDSGPGPDPTCGPTTTPGESVLVACTEKVELDVAADGIPVPRPEGSSCDLSATYSLELATRTLTWRECGPATGGGPRWIEQTGTRVLTQAEHDGLLATLRMIEVQASDSCGADKSTITVSVETDSGSQDYRDAFYACRGGHTFVAPVDPAVAAFAELAVEEPPLCCQAIATCGDGTNYSTREDCEASESECEQRTVCCSAVWCAIESDEDGGTRDDDAGP